MSEPRFRNFEEFWPYYLGEHARPGTRHWHFVGTTLAVLLLARALARPSWGAFLLPFVAGYAFAWISHALIERNRPATFRYPWWSFRADFRLWFRTLRGKPLQA